MQQAHISALFAVAKDWKQPKYKLLGKWLKKPKGIFIQWNTIQLFKKQKQKQEKNQYGKISRINCIIKLKKYRADYNTQPFVDKRGRNKNTYSCLLPDAESNSKRMKRN